MTARANWFQDLDDLPKIDPFESPLSVLMAIDLKTPEPRLERMLTELLGREEALFHEGVICDLRDLPGTTCSACPLAGNDERAPLCSVGREQEQVESTLLAKLHGRRH